MDSRKSLDLVDICYYAAIGIFFIAIIGFIIFRITDIRYVTIDKMPNCAIENLTGIFCPGCGTTRSIKALIELKPLKSLLYNVIPIMSLLFLCTFIIKESFHNLFGLKKVTERWLLLNVYIFAFTTFFQWAIKVMLLIVFHIKML